MMDNVLKQEPALFNSTYIFYLFKLVLLIFFIPSILFTFSSPAYAQSKLFSILISSNKNINSAVEDVSRLKKLGYDAFQRYERVEGKGKWYRVYVGKHESKKEAEREARVLRDKGAISRYSIREIDEEMKIGSIEGKLHKKDYYLHVSSYKQKLRAEKEVHALQEYGHFVFLVPEEVFGENWYRVYIGAFDDEQEARKTGLELNKKEIISYYKLTKGDQIRYVKKAEEKFIEPADVVKTIPPERVAEKAIEKKLEPPQEEIKESGSAVAKPEIEVAPKTSLKVAEKREEKKAEPGKKITGEESGLLYRGIEDKFSINFNMGVFLSQDAEDFKITKTGTLNDEVWEISDKEAFHIGIIPSYRFNKTLGLYSGFDGIIGDDINAWFFTLGPKFVLGGTKNFCTYFKMGAVYGTLDWDYIPGDFDNGFGWESGLGVTFLNLPFKAGINFLYRDIEFDYNAPGGQNVSANQDALDFSGFSFTVSLVYSF